MNDCCKVGRVIARHDLEHSVVGGDLNEYMLARWLGRNEYPETAVRPLKDWFNKKVLKAVYNEHDIQTIDSRIESDYKALTSDDNDERLPILTELEAAGIDGEELLKEDFIPHATLYRHFTNCLSEKKPKKNSEDGSATTNEMDRLDYARNTMEKRVQEVFKTFETKGKLPHATEADISLRVVVGCPVCTTTVHLEHALKRGYICEDHMKESDSVLTGAGDAESAEDPNGQTESPLL